MSNIQSHIKSLINKLITIIKPDAKLGFRIHLIIVSTALIPLLILHQIHLSHLNRSLLTEQARRLEGFHDNLSEYLVSMLEDTSERYYRFYSKNEGEIDVDTSVDAVYLFDKDFFPLAGSESAPLRIQLKLQDLVFKDQLEFREEVLSDGSSRLVCYVRFDDGYAFWLFSYENIKNRLNRLIPEGLSIQIFTDRFQRVLSTDNYHRQGIVVIDSFTELMIDGLSGTDSFDNNQHYFGPVQFSEVFLFMTVYESLEVNAGYRASAEGNASFIFILTLLLTSLFSFAMRSQLYRWLEKVFMNRKFSGKLKYFRRMKKNLYRLKKHIDDFAEISTGISLLDNDIDQILEHVSDDMEDE